MIGYRDVQIKEELLERIKKLCYVEHEHSDGMNECVICDKSIWESVVEKLESIATTNNAPSSPSQVETLVVPPDGFRLLTNFETMQNGDKYYKDGKWNDIFTTSWDEPYCDEIYRPVMRAV
jgi:hypothetical protein